MCKQGLGLFQLHIMIEWTTSAHGGLKFYYFSRRWRLAICSQLPRSTVNGCTLTDHPAKDRKSPWCKSEQRQFAAWKQLLKPDNGPRGKSKMRNGRLLNVLTLCGASHMPSRGEWKLWRPSQQPGVKSHHTWHPVINGGWLQASSIHLRLCGNLGKKDGRQWELPLPQMGKEKQRMGTGLSYCIQYGHLVSQNL